MGVERENIAFYGIKAKDGVFENSKLLNDYDRDDFLSNGGIIVEAKDYNKFRNKYNPKENRFICFSDGMCGEYSCIGICISSFGQDRWGEDRDLDINLSLKEIKKLDREFKKECVKQNIDISDYEPKLIVLTHYT